MTNIKISVYRKLSYIFDKLSNITLDLDRLYNERVRKKSGFTRTSVFYRMFRFCNNFSFKVGYRAFRLKERMEG